MLKFNLTISDEQGVISNIEKSFASSAVLHDFAEIETHCEEFVKSALPCAEQQLLAHAQLHFGVPEGKKKTENGL